ncbi:MFS transporter [Cellulomonas cellasea]|uniref:Major facilitator superfamily (MFS) profile domain-containing protein n=2 Tax=Cellulomonas cellasea TaxID=43670 RepID=A0A0A0BAD8_9CELL|nr:MFS transporter [Cellulomonas cellasea]KGM03072.1 hypothetical protein Q760_09715 [Cellulomonas cellasea DSM 20118]
MSSGTPLHPLSPPTPDSPGLSASVVTSGIPGHERPVPTSEHAPPTEPVRAPFMVGFAFAQLALFIALLGPVMVSMAIKVIRVVGPENATTAQGLILGVGAFAALLANPIFGRLSDRTMSRFGRRRPWMVGGSLALAACLLLIALADNVPTLVVGWFLAQLAANACFAAYLATIADQVPKSQTARISALAGVMQNVGILASIWVAGLFTTAMVPLFMVPAAIGVLGMLVFSLVLKDTPLTHRPGPLNLRAWANTFWIDPRQHPDFAWAWWSRFLLTLGSFLFSTFRFFWMKDNLGLSDKQATDTIFTGVLIYTVVLVVVGQLAGIVSDRLARRKVFVFASTALFAVGLGLLTQVTTVGGFYLVEVLLGAAFGIYMGVDLALVIEVLPNPDDAAKDLGVFNIANAGPQSVAPFLGALLIAGPALDYDRLYIVAALLVFVGALAIIPVKKVK